MTLERTCFTCGDSFLAFGDTLTISVAHLNGNDAHTHGSACSVWPTPRETMSRIKCHVIASKPGTMRTRMDDSRGFGGMNLEEVVAQRGSTGGYLNPLWTAWLMGFPLDWCVIHWPRTATP